MTDDQGADRCRGAAFTGADFTGATFRDCDLRGLSVVMKEECEHRRYAARDLAVPEGRS